MYDKLIAKITTFIPLTDDDEEIIRSLFKPYCCKKNEILIKEGDQSSLAYFVDSGYLRYYTMSEDAEEQTIHLIIPGHFSTALSSFLYNTQSEQILQSITDAKLLHISKDDLESLYNSSAKWQKFGRKIMEFFLLEKEQRVIDQLTLNATERYAKLLKEDPALVQNVPIQYIASYIGIKPESLSRIRKQIFLTNIK
ncbi:Crp/Fnr family transcriptional regulator [Dysgonomonas sp. 25]|uniref:Crp/Fnr family transcriptional regulator n=1 Tax=Dysgonomonas sp. 25 TaxID=2302933 RepID=UPI0013D47548|nr:Crp/Fnr family transcriptional regulator [Dysgonomonas sp. 25]NDV68330.1 Crp/Fnr family transcriptional regulator [Dysgonomonas sp. 25]